MEGQSYRLMKPLGEWLGLEWPGTRWRRLAVPDCFLKYRQEIANVSHVFSMVKCAFRIQPENNCDSICKYDGFSYTNLAHKHAKFFYSTLSILEQSTKGDYAHSLKVPRNR